MENQSKKRTWVAVILLGCISFPASGQKNQPHEKAEKVVTALQTEKNIIRSSIRTEKMMTIPKVNASNPISTLDYTPTSDLIGTVKKHTGSSKFNTDFDIQEEVNGFSFRKSGKLTYEVSQNMSITVGQVSIQNMTVISVDDSFSLIRQDGETWKFNNLYLLFYEQESNQFIGCIKYIEYIAGAKFLAEHKIIELNPEHFAKKGAVIEPGAFWKASPEKAIFQSLAVSPNPNKGEFFIDLNLAIDATVTIDVYDISGRRINTLIDNKNFRAGAVSEKVNISGLALGAYIVTARTGSETMTAQFIIQ